MSQAITEQLAGQRTDFNPYRSVALMLAPAARLRNVR